MLLCWSTYLRIALTNPQEGIRSWGLEIGESSRQVGFVGHAFYYHGGGMNDLGTTSGGNSTALAINSLRDVVGTAGITSSADPNISHTFLYSSCHRHHDTPRIIACLPPDP